MAAVTGIFHASHNQYYLVERDCLEITTDMYDWSNGLVSAQGHIAIIMTGTETGLVSVTADWRQDAPPLDLDDWEEVVEVSLLFDEEPAFLAGCQKETDGRDIPGLAPGSYRVRVHARGRDRGDELRIVTDAPVEEHLIQAWPAPPAAEVRHKLTDAYGARLRAL